MECFVCIHCHFYQPPRENAWLEAVESQDSAAPYHDWNERITAECYLPNGASRILDPQGRITDIVNNYARISFNFGPTLLSWMEERAPEAYQQVLGADRESQIRFSGHGSALAQAYNHIILPLANTRDKYTQIEWGITDFQHRFGRDPEGMWLPETAVDSETLDILASLGIKFTILAPHQAGKLRMAADSPWIDLNGNGIDSRRAYMCNLSSGRSIGLFFYDGAVSRAVAFEKLLFDGRNFAHRLLGRFDPEGHTAQLIHIATDGESYGHHHCHGDMALAYALDYVEKNQLARLTNYGEYFAKHPPEHEVEILEHTAWSCGHGVGRWERNCGCNAGSNAHWTQEWRKPLREALNWLRDDLAVPYESEAKHLLRDPWKARNDYVHVIIDRSPSTVNAFLDKHSTRALSEEEEERALRLLEMQRHLLLMYTSCGWFFDEPTGPETVQILQYAARAVQLSEQLFGGNREQQLLARLEQVRGNLAEFGNGRDIYERFVRPAMLDLVGVAAHYAISSLFDGYHSLTSLHCYRVQLHDAKVHESGKAKLAVGHAQITSRITRARLSFAFAALHYGDHHLTAGIRPCVESNRLHFFLEPITQAFSSKDLSECSRIISRQFGGSAFTLKSLFRDERHRIVNQIVNSTLANIDGFYAHLYEDHASLVSFLSELHMSLPTILRVSAEFVLGNALERALLSEDLDIEYIRLLLDRSRSAGVAISASALNSAFRKRLASLLEDWSAQPRELAILQKMDALVGLARTGPFNPDLWKAQTTYFDFLKSIASGNDLIVNDSWLQHFRSLGKRLGIAVEQLLHDVAVVENPVAIGPGGELTPVQTA
jgi:alpha-amylase/alpha-mannosidase (GH57 family)